MVKYMAVAVAVAVSRGVAVPVAVTVAVPVAGLTKRFFNQKYFLINVWGYQISDRPTDGSIDRSIDDNTILRFMIKTMVHNKRYGSMDLWICCWSCC